MLANTFKDWYNILIMIHVSFSLRLKGKTITILYKTKRNINDGCIQTINDGYIQTINDGFIQTINDGYIQTINDGCIQTISDGLYTNYPMTGVYKLSMTLYTNYQWRVYTNYQYMSVYIHLFANSSFPGYNTQNFFVWLWVISSWTSVKTCYANDFTISQCGNSYKSLLRYWLPLKCYTSVRYNT